MFAVVSTNEALAIKLFGHRTEKPVGTNSRIDAASVVVSFANSPLTRPFAHCAGVKPSSSPSISSVILGLVLFSSSSPGERIVPGK